jgi:purine-binding chemotaxis protein CheW
MNSNDIDNTSNSNGPAPDDSFEVPSVGITGFSAEEWTILKRRAHELARMPTDDEAQAGNTIVALSFHLGTETYAIPIQNVRQVRPLERLAPVPCAPDFVMGVVNMRGNILSLLDFRKLLGVAQEGITDLMTIIVVEAAGLEVGIAANRIGEVVWVSMDDLQAPPATIAGLGAEYITGVTAEALVLLNLETVMSNERIIVHEEVA